MALPVSKLARIFQSTPSARRATLLVFIVNAPDVISIHALREEGDMLSRVSWQCQENFNPRPPRGGRPISGAVKAFVGFISIHALREEGDLCLSETCETFPVFQSTPSARRATYCFFNKFFFKVISIHALREEGDGNVPCRRWRSIYFNPRPPRGGRR